MVKLGSHGSRRRRRGVTKSKGGEHPTRGKIERTPLGSEIEQEASITTENTCIKIIRVAIVAFFQAV